MGSKLSTNEIDITADEKIKAKMDYEIDLKPKGDIKTDEYKTNTPGRNVSAEVPKLESLQLKSKEGEIPTLGRESTISGYIPEMSIGADQPRLTKFGIETCENVGLVKDKDIEGVKIYDPKLGRHIDIGEDQPRLPKFGEAGVKVHLADRKPELEQKGKIISKSDLSEMEGLSSLITDSETNYLFKSSSDDKIVAEPSKVDTDIMSKIGEIIPGVSMIHTKESTVGVKIKTNEGKYPNIGWNVDTRDENTGIQDYSTDSGLNIQTSQYRASEKQQIHPDGTVHSFILKPEDNEKEISYSSQKIGASGLSTHESQGQTDLRFSSKTSGSISSDMRGFLGSLLTDIPDSSASTVTTTITKEVPIKYEISTSEHTVDMPDSQFEIKHSSVSSKEKQTVTKDLSYTIPEGVDPEAYLKGKLGPFTITPERT